MRGVSVVISCYNSSKRIIPTLEALSRQVTRGLSWEVIVVDNLSQDGTSQVCTDYWKFSIPFKLIQEDQPGLSHARRAGIFASEYDLILFCDDDNWLNVNYVQSAFDLMQTLPDVGILGGYGSPVFESDYIPEWFNNFYKSYAVGKQASTSGYVKEGIIYGAGMVIRKDVMVDLFNNGFSSLLSDRKGNDLISGGDNEFCYLYKAKGYQLYFDEGLLFKHFIPTNRLTQEYLEKRSEGKGRVESILRIYNDFALGKERIRWIRNPLIWYYEIVKRLGFLLILNMKSKKNILVVLQIKFLSSSIRFRFKNFPYLKKCEYLIRHIYN